MTTPSSELQTPLDEQLQPVDSTLELSNAQFIALAETDRDAALKLLWPDAQDAATMRFLDDIIFDGFLQSLKEQPLRDSTLDEPET